MSNNPAALRAIVTSFRSLADQLEALVPDTEVAPTPAHSSVTPGPIARGSVFDPEHDSPPVAPHPHGKLSEQVDWCGYLFFGRLRAINMREHRGADPSERTAIARAAGYIDARGFAGWTWTWKDLEDGRWMTDEEDLTDEDRDRGRSSGMQFLRHYAKALNVRLPDDLA